MKVKLDENLPESLVEIFAQHGHQAVTVQKEGLAGSSDETLYEIVKSEGRLFVTLDLDFSDIRSYPPNTHPGIIVIRSRSKGRNALMRMIKSLLGQIQLETLAGALTIVGDSRVRIRRATRTE